MCVYCGCTFKNIPIILQHIHGKRIDQYNSTKPGCAVRVKKEKLTGWYWTHEPKMKPWMIPVKTVPDLQIAGWTRFIATIMWRYGWDKRLFLLDQLDEHEQIKLMNKSLSLHEFLVLIKHIKFEDFW